MPGPAPSVLHALLLSSVASLALACGGTGDDTGDTGPLPMATDATCPTDSTLTYDNFANLFFEDYCRSCHDSSQVDVQREGAPEDTDYDNKLMIALHADKIDAWAGASGDVVNELMPPGSPSPTLSEREDLAEWIACDTP